MEIQGEVEELSNTSNNLPLELAKTKKQLASEKENFIEEEQGKSHASPAYLIHASYSPRADVSRTGYMPKISRAKANEPRNRPWCLRKEPGIALRATDRRVLGRKDAQYRPR